MIHAKKCASFGYVFVLNENCQTCLSNMWRSTQATDIIVRNSRILGILWHFLSYSYLVYSLNCEGKWWIACYMKRIEKFRWIRVWRIMYDKLISATVIEIIASMSHVCGDTAWQTNVRQSVACFATTKLDLLHDDRYGSSSSVIWYMNCQPICSLFYQI